LHKQLTIAPDYVQNIIRRGWNENYIPPEDPVMKCKVTFCLKETVWVALSLSLSEMISIAVGFMSGSPPNHCIRHL
nr:hypothetical protein [Clostridia bacterium]